MTNEERTLIKEVILSLQKQHSNYIFRGECPEDSSCVEDCNLCIHNCEKYDKLPKAFGLILNQVEGDIW